MDEAKENRSMFLKNSAECDSKHPYLVEERLGIEGTSLYEVV